MKNSCNTDTDLKKSIAYKKACVPNGSVKNRKGRTGTAVERKNSTREFWDPLISMQYSNKGTGTFFRIVSPIYDGTFYKIINGCTVDMNMFNPLMPGNNKNTTHI